MIDKTLSYLPADRRKRFESLHNAHNDSPPLMGIFRTNSFGIDIVDWLQTVYQHFEETFAATGDVVSRLNHRYAKPLVNGQHVILIAIQLLPKRHLPIPHTILLTRDLRPSQHSRRRRALCIIHTGSSRTYRCSPGPTVYIRLHVHLSCVC